MRFYTKQHKNYCGIDLHTNKMYVCILEQKGEAVFHRNMKTKPELFLKAIEPFREDIVVSAECMFAWYWLADLCEDEGIPFILGHALYMKAIHGGKSKNDKVDSRKIAGLLRGGLTRNNRVRVNLNLYFRRFKRFPFVFVFKRLLVGELKGVCPEISFLFYEGL